MADQQVQDHQSDDAAHHPLQHRPARGDSRTAAGRSISAPEMVTPNSRAEAATSATLA
jgi:hypothetical protein